MYGSFLMFSELSALYSIVDPLLFLFIGMTCMPFGLENLMVLLLGVKLELSNGAILEDSLFILLTRCIVLLKPLAVKFLKLEDVRLRLARFGLA